jgi:outer membrane receptor for ferrienterochelin and colicin
MRALATISLLSTGLAAGMAAAQQTADYEDIVVAVASLFEQSLADAPAAVTALTAEDIERMPKQAGKTSSS